MDNGITVLRLLAENCYLTCSQMKTLWINVSAKSLYRILGCLRWDEHALIWTKRFPVHPKHWTYEDIHYLTPQWRKYLIHNQRLHKSQIKIPIWSTNFFQDYLHRKKCIDIKIVLASWLRNQWAVVRIYDSYFEWKFKQSGKGRGSATKISLNGTCIRPDANVLFDKSWKSHLLCLELHMGQDVVRICQQLKQHVQAISMWAPSIKYNLPTSNRVLSIFESSSCMFSTIERISEDQYFTFMKDHFLFCGLDTLLTNEDIQVLSLRNDSIKLIE